MRFNKITMKKKDKKIITNSNNNNRRSDDRHRAKQGISPVIATTIILGITVTLGIALWSFANSNAGTSAATYANTVTDYINYLRERFVIVSMAFKYDAIDNSSPSSICTDNSKCVSVWIYNNGQVSLNVRSVMFTSNSGNISIHRIYGCVLHTDNNGSSVCSNDPVEIREDSMFRLGAKELGVITFETDQALSNNVYTVRILTERGNIQAYTQSLT
jgi:hypothetical protein